VAPAVWVIGVGPPSRRQAGERLVEDGDVVCGGVGAGTTGAQQPRQGFAPGDLGAVQKGQQRVVTVGLLPGRGGLLLVIGVVDNQGGVDIDVQPVPGNGGGASVPGRRSSCCAGRTHPRQVRGIDPFIDQPPHRGGRGFRTQGMLTVAA
jgi:hypothetical protein